jgi:esterase/lipase
MKLIRWSLKNISARVLIDLADTAQRVVADAAAIDLPVLMLVAGKDYVVKTAAQQTFYDRLSSALKRWCICWKRIMLCCMRKIPASRFLKYANLYRNAMRWRCRS